MYIFTDYAKRDIVNENKQYDIFKKQSILHIPYLIVQRTNVLRAYIGNADESGVGADQFGF